MACVDPNCKSYFRGEILPIFVEVTLASGSDFNVIVDENQRTFCEVRNSAGELLTTLYPSLVEISTSKKQLLCSWNTTGVEVGYYTLIFWISINISGDKDIDDNYIEEYKMTSETLNRYIKV
jgi:hypothetical protein